jgi:stearoyl-CoA desaturase (Delta-9 desaturase)
MKLVLRWLDNAAVRADGEPRAIDWLRVAPFFAIHALALAAFQVGASAELIALAAALYAVRMFAITGFYHRYLSHRAYRTSRAFQLLLALIAASAAQRGPLWWAAHHRHHHAHADREADAHSPRRHGLLWSHTGWFLARESFRTRLELVPDWVRYPELRFLDRFDALAPLALALALYAIGGWPWLVWGFGVSTVALYHATFAVNSLAHRFGTRRYETRDDSRNNALVALATLGEGWHNNHHRFPGRARQGVAWWELDLTWEALRLLEALRLVRELRR